MKIWGKRVSGRGESKGQGPAMGKSMFNKAHLKGQGLQGGGMWTCCFMGTVSVWGDKKFWKQTVVIVAHIVNAINAPELYM